jgi:DNA-binding response OmpR family regulator
MPLSSQEERRMTGLINRKGTILVVDDEKAYCDATAEVLRGHGFTVVQAYDARQAKAALGKTAPDAILLDIMMPEIDGLTLLRELAAMPSFLNTPLVVVSAKAQPSDRNEAWMAGADAYLAKPFTSHELLAVVDYVLRLTPEAPPGTAPLGESRLKARMQAIFGDVMH